MRRFLLALALGLDRRDRRTRRRRQPAQRVLRSDARALCRRSTRPSPRSSRPTTGKTIEIKQSHGGSGKQARSVIDGLAGRRRDARARLRHRRDRANAGCSPKDWQKRLPQNAAPYTSTIVFLVRKGNPKGIKDWDDLAKPGVKVITPNPKTSGGARWNYLAAWGYALKKIRRNDGKGAAISSRDIYKNVPVLDTGARGSTVTFVERNVGDVLIAWENEAYLALNEFGKDKFEIVDAVASRSSPSRRSRSSTRWSTRKARAPRPKRISSSSTRRKAQEIAAQNYYRPRDPAVAKKYEASFAKVELFTIDDVFGGWQKAQADAFQGWRRVRQDLHALSAERAVSEDCHADVTAPQRDPGLRDHAGRHAALALADRADPARRAFSQDHRTVASSSSSPSSPAGACCMR